MPFSAILSGVTIGASITNVSLYPCTGSTSGTCSGTVIPNYSNVAKSSLSPSLTVSGITDGTTYIKLVASGGGCTPDLILPISNIPGAATLTPTPTAGANPTPSPTPTATSGPNPPTSPPTPSPTPMFKTIQISNPQSSVEGACGVSSGLTKYISSAYSNITNGIVVYNTSSLDPNDKYLPNGAADYWPIIFNGSTYATTFASGDAGAISTVVDCGSPLTFTATVDKTQYGEQSNNIVTVTVTSSRSAAGTYLWWGKHAGTATTADFINYDTAMLITAATGYTFELVIDDDETTEGDQTFAVAIFTGSTSTKGGQVAQTATFTILDDSIEPQYRYARLEQFLDQNGCPIPYFETNKDYYWDQVQNGQLDGGNQLYSGGGYCYKVDSFFNDPDGSIRAGKSEISGATLNNCPSCPG
jgi:hypothetical protein